MEEFFVRRRSGDAAAAPQGLFDVSSVGTDRSRVPVEGDFAKSRDELAERQ